MENPGNFRLIVEALFIFCLVNLSLGFNPVDEFLLDCGSSRNRSLGDRQFVADNSNTSSYNLSTPQHIFANSSSNPISLYYDSSLYRTARIFNGPSDYSFPIKEQGRHLIRLHFFPFVYGKYNMSNAKFSVSAQNFSLTREPQSGNVSVVKEYSLNITSNRLVLSFIPDSVSFAFINALEVFSIPENIVPEEAKTIGRKDDKRSLRDVALETVARVDMGNSTVLPQNDTLWRLWVSDDEYLIDKNLGSFVSNVSAVNFTGGLVTEDIAPASVYGTATRFNLDDPNLNANLTWSFDVDPGLDYLVRLHFCDIVSNSSTQQGVFVEIFINTHSAGHLDLGSQTSHVLGAPYFMDVCTRAHDSRKLNVSVGSSNIINFPSVILNGLEIMKINNAAGGFDAPEVVSSRTSKIALIVGLTVGLFVFVVLAAVLILFCQRRRKPDPGNGGRNVHVAGNGTAIFFSSKIGYRFPFMALVEATDNFSENLVIGVGGFGKVYKGVLWDETEVAVKRGTPQSSQGLTEFRTEIEMLSQFRHRHLVSLIGYCDEHNEMIIIYEYMENGTLKNHLYGSSHPCLSWRQRLEICIGSAKGLHYLHTGSTNSIIHRDVKSANILLDKNFMAKVADFGLSKTGPDIDRTHVSTAVKGSFGYLDPEYLTTQQLTEKSDVYSFGVVLLEVLCGRPVIYPSLPREKVNLVDWALKSRSNGRLEDIVDPRLVGEIKPESLNKFWEITEKCLGKHGIYRPSMGDVLWNLESTLQLQRNEQKTAHDGELSSGISCGEHLETSSEFILAGSVSELAGVSMTTVFAQMLSEQTR
ncbi:putative receptor-like protein kinase [Hibiscus syriacus]|uniref:Receptor-like protein kinase n=1 Tax=Hibiscus syriacus TaxID=106335 RepID=A0A6A2YZD2_HIBSY|nr:probable receptor-like protein kinase At2g39360 [Hibiscus syriacus]KAE8684898.1 putative receptor-like protein kinase [Hibiscus syriacus]